MCELFGVSGSTPIRVNPYLKEFASHSTEHPNGWGLAVFYGNAVSLEKEAFPAYKSRCLKDRLKHPLDVTNMFAHIRLATKGGVDYENCHPFVKRDSSGRAWTLIHNGTIFECPLLNHYIHIQYGQTDSERILWYIVDCINRRMKEPGREPGSEERFEVMEKILYDITFPNNKVNLLVYDSELTYVHTNMRDTFYFKELNGSTLFASVPLDDGIWEPLPVNRLLAWKGDKMLFQGADHGHEYIYDPEDIKYLYLDHAYL